MNPPNDFITELMTGEREDEGDEEDEPSRPITEIKEGSWYYIKGHIINGHGINKVKVLNVFTTTYGKKFVEWRTSFPIPIYGVDSMEIFIHVMLTKD